MRTATLFGTDSLSEAVDLRTEINVFKKQFNVEIPELCDKANFVVY